MTYRHRYPKVERINVKETFHYVELEDPYRWLEDLDSKETQEFVEKQNAITKPYLEEYPFKNELMELGRKCYNFPRFGIPFKYGDKYYQGRNSGLQNQTVYYQMDSFDEIGEVFLDVNTFSSDGTVNLNNLKFSNNGKIVAYSISFSGSDWEQIKIRNVVTNHDYPEILEKVKYSNTSWLSDDNGFFYSGFLDQSSKVDGSNIQSLKNHKIYYHKLGTAQSEDIVVVEFENPDYINNARVSYCGNFLVVDTKFGTCNLVHFAILNGPPAHKLELVPVISELTAEYKHITNNSNDFIFITNKDAPNRKIIVIDFDYPDERYWQVLVEESATDVIKSARPIDSDKLIIIFLRDVKYVLTVYDMHSGQKFVEIPNDIGSINLGVARRDYSEIFYNFTSFSTPPQIFRIEFEKEKITPKLIYSTQVGELVPKEFITEQIFYNSKDNTEIPMFIVHKKNFLQDGEAPCLLYGYGGFNHSQTPAFYVNRAIFMKHFNGCFALANIRGGGEYGEEWHKGGSLNKKQNCFDDFKYAAKYLIENKFTNPSKLTIEGGSNGGLLVAACINQTPELFGAAIIHVGLLDMLRYHLFTIGAAWIPEYGCSENPEDFKILLKYSPYHNVKIPESGQYPATLVLTADHDDRVVPLHSYKFIAELQYKLGKHPQQVNPLMILVETKAGHGMGKPISKILEQGVNVYSFIAKALDLEFIP